MRSLVFFASLALLLAIIIGCKKDTVPICAPTDIVFTTQEKIKGVNMDCSTDFTTDTVYNPVVDVNAEWASIVPFGHINVGPYDFSWSQQSGYWGLQDVGLEQMAMYAKSRGLKTMIKPQVLINGGAQFTGTYDPGTEAEWAAFENDFREFTLHYAQMAVATNADMFCIGTEWRAFVLERRSFWRNLIAEVRAIYSGTLTYASNWDEYLEVPFWEEIDVIGVDAYFSIAESETPEVSEVVQGWQEHLKVLGQFACRQGKQIIFTEYGYRSTHNAAYNPWDTEYLPELPENFNEVAQANALAGLYQALWEEEWFAGGFVWKWFAQHHTSGGTNDNRYTPQNKLAEETIREYYGKL